MTRERTASRYRFWEVDVWRGVAIVTMTIYHLVFDLWAFAGMNIALTQGFWFYFQRFTATSFILLVGISLTISYQQVLARRGTDQGLFIRFFKRGLKVLAVAMVLTLVFLFSGVGRVDFGVLHLIGTSIILAYPFLPYRWFNLILALVLFALSYPISTVQVDTYALVWLGFQPPNYVFSDYFPLVHWFGVVLIGIFLGNTLYAGGERRFHLPDLGEFFPLSLLGFLGRHSLFIYVIHQPLLILLLLLTGVISLRTFGF